MSAADTISVGVVGLGYWGPNLARNYDALPGVELRWCCDRDVTVRERLAARHPRSRFTADLALIVTAHPSVDHDAIVERAPLVLDLRGVTRRSRDPGAVLL